MACIFLDLVTVAGVDPDGVGPMPRPTTTIVYDGLGQKASLIDPDMGMWLYRWDLAGNLRKQRDARNVLTCFYYDNLNRLVGKSFHPNTPDPASVNCSTQPTPYPVAYSYDTGPNGKGRRTGMADPSGSTAWEYDVRGRMTKETKVVSGTGGGTFVTQWNSYDAMDRVRSMTYPDGEGVTFSYAAQGPIKTVYGSNTYYVGETLYSALGQVTDRYLGSTAGLIRQKYTYTQAENFRLTSLRSGTSASGYTNLQNLSYSYDAVGNVVSIVDAALTGGSQTQTFTYDALHRLTRGYSSGNMSGWYDEDYTYDPAGNLTTKGKPKSIWWAYSYGQQAADCPQGALSKPHAVVSAVAMPYFNHYCYDQNGNMVRRRLGTADVLPRTADAPVSSIGQAIPETQVIDTYLLAYDEENWLKEVSLNGAVVATYTYDGDGKRVKAVVEGVATVYIGNHYERDNGTTVKKYYYAGEVRIAMRTGGNTHYLLNDHLNSTAITTNSNGALVASLLYKPWGETRYDFGVTPTTWRFTGQREDATIGLYYFNARHYDAALGRFIQPDTIVPEPGNPQALNRYSYVLNNPVKYSDPSGHCPICVTAGVGFLGGVIISAGSQFIGGLSQGLSVDQAFHQIDAGKVIAAGLAGGVAGLTFGIGTAVLGTGIIATGISGAAAGVVEGRMGVIADSTWNEVERWKSGQSFETRRLWDEAVTNGLIDPMSMAIDAGSGAITANLGREFGNWLMDQGIMVRSTATTHAASVPTIRLLPNGGITLELGRQPLQLSQDVWDGIIAALMEGNAALAEELLSKSMDEILHGIANPGGNP